MPQKVPIIAIVGRANVGKSSLFNAILRRREAIVANEPGTTRNNVVAKASHQGHDFWLVDTAGLKDPADDFEFTIQEQIIQAATTADCIWVVIEAPAIISEEDRRVAKLALKTKKPVFLVVNKSDQAKGARADDYQKLGIKPIILTSATQNRGIQELLGLQVSEIPTAHIKESPDRLRVALLGRPNVGKSSLFNSLAHKQQAIVAERAGTTRDINRVIINFMSRELELLDTAGIRRSGKIEKGVEKFSVLRSLSAIEEADICLLLIDVNESAVQLDQKIAGMIQEAGKGLILVVTKWDLLDDSKTPFTRDQLAATIRDSFAFVAWAPLVFTSSVSGQNVTKLFELALEIDSRRHLQITTSQLNQWLRQTVNSHPPAGLKNRLPKLNYIVQESDNPINFKVFGAHTKFLHWSYKRFMERRLREIYDFAGTPVKFWFFDKHVTHKHGQPANKSPQRDAR